MFIVTALAGRGGPETRWEQGALGSGWGRIGY
jgi:hypothetical protein